MVIAPLMPDFLQLHLPSDAKRASLPVSSPLPNFYNLAIDRLQQQLHQQSRYQKLVNEMIVAIHGGVEVGQILQQAIAGISQVLQVEHGLILLFKYTDFAYRSRLDNRSPEATVRLANEWPSSANSPSNLPVFNAVGGEEADGNNSPAADANSSFWLSECSLCQHIVAEVPPYLILHRDETNPLWTGMAGLLHSERWSSMLVLPLTSRGTVLGLMVLQQNRTGYLWESEAVELASLISAQISTAIIQTQTLRQVQALVKERTAQLHRSLEVQSRLYETTRQQMEQLRQSNQLKDEFLSTISHELRTPLTSMTLAIRMLRQAELTPDRRMKYLDILEQQCNQESNLINDLLTMQKLQSNPEPLRFQSLDLKQLIRDVASRLEQTYAAKGLTLELNLPRRSLLMESNADSIQRILEELLTNAGKYGDRHSTVQLRVSSQDTETAADSAGGEQIVIQVTNTGLGIPPDELPHIFDQFHRGQGVTQQAIPGTGLGLTLIKFMTQHLQGTIAATSHPLDQSDNQGENHSQSWETCFTLVLPQRPNQPTL